MGRYAWLCALAIGFAHSASASYKILVTGPGSVYRGYDAYFSLATQFSGARAHVFLSGMTAPQGFRAHFGCSPSMPDCWKDEKGRVFNYGGEEPTILHLMVDKTVGPGRYRIIVNTEAGGQQLDTPIDIQIKDIPATASVSTVGPTPAIPKRKQWEQTMVELGSKWCNTKHPNEVYGFGVEAQVWYYDGARVYFQIADYTGNPKWEGCALNVARQYRDYVNGVNGKVPGWRVFPHGLRMAYERTHDESFRKALRLLVNSPFGTAGGLVPDDYIRETAYIAEVYMNMEKAGEPRNPLLSKSIAILLGHFDMLFETGNYHLHQPFFDGIAAEALIEYYQMTPDPRIPPAIRQMCDWEWEKGWNPKSKALVYNPDPTGPRCSENCQYYLTGLINLTVPAFAWVWRQTGDVKYLREGDEMFSHALDTEIDFSGKVFSQNYRWSFDYVRWRTAGK